MAFNKFMHPQNPYRVKKPNFKELALKYDEFRQHSTQDTAGKVHLDFKDPKALRALSWAILKDDFDLDVEMPLERLIPTVPLRLNYILWLKDIVGAKADVEVKGIDLGCGASCVYPMLGSKLYKWKMLTTEVDELNLTYAKRNVEKNRMGDFVEVMEVKEGTGLYELLQDVGGNFDFCMCNPPFFESNIEAYGLKSSRTSSRPEPKSVSTASEQESIIEGGEVAYVKKMIDDSLKLKNRIRVYTSMLGIKKSVGVLKKELYSKKVSNISSYQFCQGRTMRWGLAWTFDSTVNFPVCPFSAQKQKPAKPLVYTVKPTVIEESVESIGKEVKKILQDLKIEHTIVMCCQVVWSVSATAWEDTWSHGRRKRRMLARQQQEETRRKATRVDDHESGILTSDTLTCTQNKDLLSRNEEDNILADRFSCSTKGQHEMASSDENNEKSVVQEGDNSICDSKQKQPSLVTCDITNKEKGCSDCATEQAKSSPNKSAEKEKDSVKAELCTTDSVRSVAGGQVISAPLSSELCVSSTKGLVRDELDGSPLNKHSISQAGCLKEGHSDGESVCDNTTKNDSTTLNVDDEKMDFSVQITKKSDSNGSTEGNLGVSDIGSASTDSRERCDKEMDSSAKKEDKPERLPLFKCWVSVRKEKPGIILEMKWIRGSSKEALHQVFQYFQNHIR